MIVYISGGCKNGKSGFAEKIANFLYNKQDNLYYIATMKPCDNEDEKRIINHKKQREIFNFKTIEITKNIKNLENLCDLNSTFLLDSATALLANEMFLENGEFFPKAHKKVCDDLLYILKKVKNIVIVSDYIYADAIKYDDYTKAYKKGLAFIDKNCAQLADILIEVSYGNLIFYKGKEKLNLKNI